MLVPVVAAMMLAVGGAGGGGGGSRGNHHRRYNYHQKYQQRHTKQNQEVFPDTAAAFAVIAHFGECIRKTWGNRTEC